VGLGAYVSSDDVYLDLKVHVLDAWKQPVTGSSPSSVAMEKNTTSGHRWCAWPCYLDPKMHSSFFYTCQLVRPPACPLGMPAWLPAWLPCPSALATTVTTRLYVSPSVSSSCLSQSEFHQRQ
jgi:hypothetical protein